MPEARVPMANWWSPTTSPNSQKQSCSRKLANGLHAFGDFPLWPANRAVPKLFATRGDLPWNITRRRAIGIWSATMRPFSSSATQSSSPASFIPKRGIHERICPTQIWFSIFGPNAPRQCTWLCEFSRIWAPPMDTGKWTDLGRTHSNWLAI